MFFGKMQSFYRRNSIYNQSQSPSKGKEQMKHTKNISKHKNDTGEDYHLKNSTSFHRSSFSISRNRDCDEQPEMHNRGEIPVIKIGLYESETGQKSNILKEKEKALWYGTSHRFDDNSERLGPNKNNIIEETLRTERQKSGDWGC